MELYNFPIRGSFIKEPVFGKECIIKKNVNLQSSFVLTVSIVDTISNVDIKTSIHLQNIITLLKEYILFIGCLYYFSVHFHAYCFYIQCHGGLREITSMPVLIFCFELCSILLT